MQMKRDCYCKHPDISLEQAVYTLSCLYYNLCKNPGLLGNRLSKHLVETFVQQLPLPDDERILDINARLSVIIQDITLVYCSTCAFEGRTCIPEGQKISNHQAQRLFQFKNDKGSYFQLYIPLHYFDNINPICFSSMPSEKDDENKKNDETPEISSLDEQLMDQPLFEEEDLEYITWPEYVDEIDWKEDLDN